MALDLGYAMHYGIRGRILKPLPIEELGLAIDARWPSYAEIGGLD
jgi:hypothetical protein